LTPGSVLLTPASRSLTPGSVSTDAREPLRGVAELLTDSPEPRIDAREAANRAGNAYAMEDIKGSL